MKVKRLAAAVLAALITASAITACTNGGENEPASESEAAVTVGADGRTKEGIMYTEGLPIVDPGDYEFTIFVDDSNNKDDYIMLPIFEEETGVKVNIERYPFEIAQEKLTLALNSGNYADCIGGWTLKANDILTLGMEEGVYIQLDEIFKKYCPKIEEILELEGVRDAMTTPDGHIYSVPYAIEAPTSPYNILINTEWLDKLGLEMPATTEEFRTVLKAFKEQDPNGNGEQDEIPFTVDPDNKNLGLLCGWFGLPVNDEGFTMVGDELTFGANSEEYKMGIQYLASLYAEGLVDIELFTQDLSQWRAKDDANRYGAKITYGYCGADSKDPAKYSPFHLMPVLSSPECSDPVWLRNSYGTAVLKSQVVITDKAEHPEVIARWWDYIYNLEPSLQCMNGPLGVTLFKNDDGTYKHIDMTTMSDDDRQKYGWYNLWPQSLSHYIPAGFKVKQEGELPDLKELDAYEPFLTEAIPDYWMTAENASRYAEISTSIRDYITQKKAEWIVGQSDIDAEWDGYIEQLKKMGVEEMVEMRRNALKKAE